MKKSLILCFFCSLIFLQFCTSTKKIAPQAKADMAVANVTYEKDIQPIIVNRCTPCHFPEKGNKKFLNS